MKAIVVNQSGSIDELKLQYVDEPTTPDGFVKIKTKAFGLNRAEVYFRSGSWGEINEPKIPGIEAAGEIVEDSSGQFHKGQKVITAMGGLMMARDGSYAEYIVAPVSNVLAVETKLPWEELAAIPQAFLTIWGALDKTLNIKTGQSILVRGGTTTLGFAAIAYAKARGLTVVATTRSRDNERRLIDKGADHVIIDNGEVADKIREFLPEGIDNALDVIGVSTIKDTLNAVKYWGQVCVVGVLTGTDIEKFNLMSDMPNTVKLSFFSSGLLGSPQMPFSESPIAWIIEQIESNKMPSLISKIYDFDLIKEAHEAMENNQISGKAVIRV
jgi:NADPH:quinone reductase